MSYPNQAQGSQSWDIGGDAGNSFQFDVPGASVTGTIKNLSVVQQTNITTGEPEFWPSGQPKEMYRVSLATSLRDPGSPSDDGTRDIYLKGSRKAESKSSLSAVLQAVKVATGDTNLEPGGTLTLTYVGDGQPEKGKNPPKQYTANYLRPVMNLGGQPAPQQPVYQPQQASAPQQTYQAPQQVAAPAQQAYQPQQPAQPVPAAAQQQWPWTPEQLAAVKASGVDPASVWPQAWPAYLAGGGQ